MILYTKQGCQKCEYIKARLGDILQTVEERDITDAKAHRGELMRNGVYDIVQRTMPVLVDDEGEIYTGLEIIVFLGANV